MKATMDMGFDDIEQELHTLIPIHVSKNCRLTAVTRQEKCIYAMIQRAEKTFANNDVRTEKLNKGLRN